MQTILNISKLANIISSEEIAILEANGLERKKAYNVIFKIQSVNENDIYIQTTQGKRLSAELNTDESLIRITKNLFQPFLPNKIINVHPSPFLIPVVEVVTPEWIRAHLNKYKIKIKNLSDDTGIPTSNFSAWINGLRPMSQIVKAMIFNIMKIYSLKELVNWLDADSTYPRFFFIKKYFDLDLIKTLVYNNKNTDNYIVKFKEGINDYEIILTPR